jgi:hypothetical protein
MRACNKCKKSAGRTSPEQLATKGAAPGTFLLGVAFNLAANLVT